MRAVDTNVLVRLVARDDAKQTALAEAFVAKGAWVSLSVEIARKAGRAPRGTFDRALGRLAGVERLSGQ